MSSMNKQVIKSITESLKTNGFEYEIKSPIIVVYVEQAQFEIRYEKENNSLYYSLIGGENMTADGYSDISILSQTIERIEL